MDEPGPWATPSDLAEYAFCPRAHFYRRHGEAPPSAAAVAGERYHRGRLSSERWRAEHGRVPWSAVAAGVVLLVAAVLLLAL